MPILTRECLALKLRQNWLAKHPVDAPPTTPLDDSLTSLNWLQNLNIMKITTPTPPASPSPEDDLNLAVLPQYTPQTQVNPNAVLNMGNVKVKQEPGSPISSPSALYKLTGQMMDVAPPTTTNPNAFHDKIDYKTNPYVKPPYSYATLICMAMKETKKNKITLAGIYNWITENFMYYRHADPSWQNSIRHNLSLNKCFQKVPRRKDEPGKGGFWRINPEYEDMFINGIFKKRRASATPTNLQPITKRMKLESCEDSNSSLSDTDGDSSPMLNTAAVELAVRNPPNTILGHVNTNTTTATTPPSFEIKQEPLDNVFPTPPADHHLLDDHIDFNWNSLLTQDIEVAGLRIKTEDLIESSQDSSESDIASPITTLSPPPSDSNSEIAIEDFISNTDFTATEFEDPLDFTTGQPLDLSISGMSLKPPEWWSDSINDSKGFFSPSHSQQLQHQQLLQMQQQQEAGGNKDANSSGLSTPVLPHSLSVMVDCDHPWAEDKNQLDEAIASFDTDIAQLFDLDNIPSPRLTHDA